MQAALARGTGKTCRTSRVARPTKSNRVRAPDGIRPRPHHVALAQYLYHEYVFFIFGWGCDNRPLSAQMDMLLVYGQIPCFLSWGKAISPPANNRLVGDYYDAMRGRAKDFLLFGRMRRPLVAASPDASAIIQSAWDDGRGNVGVFVVNIRNGEAALKVHAPGDGRWPGPPICPGLAGTLRALAKRCRLPTEAGL